MKGYLIVNGFLHNERFQVLYEMLKKAFNEEEIELSLITNDKVLNLINDENPFEKENEVNIVNPKDNFVIQKDNFVIQKDNFVIFWDKDILLASHLENLGYRVFNKAKAIELCDDKGLMAVYLEKENIPLPKTIIAPFTFNNNPYNDFSFVTRVINKLGLPLIMKQNKGSFGHEVYLLNSLEEIITKIKEIGPVPIIFQEFIKTSYGRDVRIEVVGHKAIGSVMRIGKDNDFRANILSGGTMHSYEAPESFIKLSEKVSRLLDLDFCGVDILFGENDTPILCEVNSNVHFKTFYTVTNKNLASVLAKYIKTKLS